MIKRLQYLLIALSLTGASYAQVGDTALWSPNGPVQSLLLHDSILYVGGVFTQVSPVLGHFTVMDSSSAQNAPPFPKVTGRVNCMTKDSLGRTYVGGSFNSVGRTAIRNLFRLDSLGNLDVAFQPNPDAEVMTLYIYGDTLYVGGDFNTIEGFPRGRGAGLKVTFTYFSQVDSQYYCIPGTDSLIDFDPRADNVIYSYAMDNQMNGLLVGGEFQNIGGAAVSFMSCLSPLTGDVVTDTHNLPWSTSINGPVRSIAVQFGHAIAGGDFTMAFGSFSRKGLVSFEIFTEVIDTNFNAHLNGFVNDVKLVGSRLYIGGTFTIVQSQARNHIAALTTTSALLPWNPSAGSDVYCINLWKDVVCVAGKFNVIGTSFCYHAALIDSVTGLPHAWDPKFDNTVRVILPTNASSVYCGGDFMGANGVMRSDLCAININTKQPTSWAPLSSGPVSTMAADDNSLFIAGTFTSIDSFPRSRIASFDLTTGNLNAFDPGVNGNVRTIASDDSLVYVGGNFTTIAGQQRDNIACIQFANSSANNWDPGVSGTVNKLIIDHNTIYVGGFYPLIAGQSHDNLSRVDRYSAVPDMFWNCNTNDGIYDLDLYNGKLTMGGWFSSVNSSSRQYFAISDTIDGSLYANNPGFDSYVRCFARYTTDLFVSGAFNNVGGNLFYPGVCDYDYSSNSFDQWSPSPSSFPQALASDQDWLFMGGTFIVAGGVYHPYLAMVNVNYVTGKDEYRSRDHYLRLYPNPASGFCNIDPGDLEGTISSCDIRDISGRTVSEIAIDQRMQRNSLQLDLRGLAPGLYTITLRTEEGDVCSGKISVQ